MDKLRATLTRTETSDQGTFGTLDVVRENTRNTFRCLTAELPWRDNTTDRSCIPKGVYQVIPHYNGRLQEQGFLIGGVPGRTGILIHRGNFAGDVTKGYRSNVEGCILVGSALVKLDGQKAVSSSRHTLAKLVAFVAGDSFNLTIR